MKIIFLDIDGVLNSAKYDKTRTDTDGNRDITRLPTWRKFWERNEEKITETGREINKIFASAGIIIFDKTPVLGRRKDEILAWLSANEGVTAFCIIDDMYFGWDELSDFLVKTDPLIGRGLEEKQVALAIQKLSI